MVRNFKNLLLLSIIIPCYNQGIFLIEALESIHEVFIESPFEIIIINDGSTDEQTNEIINSLDKLKYSIIFQENKGLATARNNGIRQAKGDYILLLDSDNKLHKNYMHGLKILQNNPLIDVVYGNPIFFGKKKGVKRIGEFNISKLLKENFIDACALFKKEIWLKNGGFDSKMPAMGNEDWEFWISSFFNGGKFYFLDKPCFYYRVSENSMSVTTTRPNFFANRGYIHNKHIQNVLNIFLRESELLNYIRENKIKAAAKLILGYRF